jgi:hypothetical protein
MKFCNFTFYYYLCERKKETPQAARPWRGFWETKVLIIKEQRKWNTS